MSPVQFGSHTHSQLVPLNCKYLPPGETHLGGSVAVSRASSRVFNPSSVVFRASSRVFNPSSVVFRASSRVFNPSSVVFKTSIRPLNSVSFVFNSASVVFNASMRLTCSDTLRPSILFDRAKSAFLSSAFVAFKVSIRPLNSVSLVFNPSSVLFRASNRVFTPSILAETPTSPSKQYTSPSTRTFGVLKTISEYSPVVSKYTSPSWLFRVTLLSVSSLSTGYPETMVSSFVKSASRARRTQRCASTSVKKSVSTTSRRLLLVAMRFVNR